MAINLDHVTEQITVTDTTTDASLTVNTKGTGAFNIASGSSGVNISNGGTVTAVTVTALGSYTSTPTATISAPTTAGGVQATFSFSLQVAVPTVSSGGTGYTVGDVLTLSGGTLGTGGYAATVTVSTVSGGVITGVTISNYGAYTVVPTGAIALTGGTGSGAAITSTWYVRSSFPAPSITNAGSGYVEQPTVTFSGGGGSGAAAYATVGSGTTIRSLGATGLTGLSLSTPSGEALRLVDAGTTVANYLIGYGAGTNSTPTFGVAGTDTNITFNAVTKGSGQFNVYTNWPAGPVRQFNVSHTASAVNYVQLTGAATGNQPVISMQGSDSTIGMRLQSKGTSFVYLQNALGTTQFSAGGTSSAVNYLNARGNAAGTSPQLEAVGSDANLNINLTTKGTGNVQQNGVNLALSTHKYHAFTVGSYYFDNYEQPNYFRLFTQNATTDTIRYKTVTSPEYYDYGTSTWTAWAAGQSGIQDLLDGNPATGINVAHANRTFRFVVSGVDGWPTNVLVMLQTTWSAIAYTTATVTIASSTAIGGPFTSRQVMVFSGANTGNNWGMHAYYTGSIHTGDTFYQITIDLTDWVDVSTYTTYPLRNLCIFSNYSTAGGIDPYTTTYGKNASFIGGITTGTDVNGGLGIGRYNSSDTNAYLDAIGSASGMFQRVNYWPATRLAYTASSVNYLQFAGSTTGFGPLLSAQGSDTNIPLVLQPKGTGALQAQQTDSTATGGNARGTNAVDWQTVRGAASSVASGPFSVIGGGSSNGVNSSYGGTLSGVSNNTTGFASVISGGWSNSATGGQSAVVGGYSNSATGAFNFIGGGTLNSGTANAAVTTQTGTMNGTTAVTLSAPNAAIKVGQYITGTSIAFQTYVTAISGTSLTLSQAASGSSTSTLSFYTPHGVVVGGGNNTATGSYSFIGGGGDAGTAGNRNVASGDWSFVGGGAKNVASGPASVIAGGGFLGTSIFGNTASADTTFIGGGILNVASNSGAVIAGGWQNIANGILSTVSGGRYATARGISGINVFSTTAPIADNWGVSQSSILIVGRQTTDATATRLTSDTAAASTTNQVILPNNSAYYFFGTIVAGVTGGGDSKGWRVEGLIKRGANAAATTLVGSTVTSSYADAGASTWTIALSADTTNGGLAVTFTGQASTTIRCVAKIETTEMTY